MREKDPSKDEKIIDSNIGEKALQSRLQQFEQYLLDKEGLTHVCRERYAHLVRPFLECAESLEPSDEEARQYRQKVLMGDKTRFSNGHINNAQKAIELYFAFVGKEEDLPERDLPLIRPKTNPRRENSSSVQEMSCDILERLTSVAVNPRDKAIILTIQSSEIRSRELVNLSVEDIDMETGTLSIQNSRIRGRRLSSVSRDCLELIQQYLDKRPESSSDALFQTRRGERLSTSDLKKMIKGVASRAGIKKSVTPYRIRQAAVASAVERNLNVFYVRTLLSLRTGDPLSAYWNPTREELWIAYQESLDGK